MAGILRSTSMLSVVGSVTPVMVGDLRGCRLRFAGMRDRETIDSELRLLVAVRRTARELTGSLPSPDHLVDALLDERSRILGADSARC
jgi:hypothetical protein